MMSVHVHWLVDVKSAVSLLYMHVYILLSCNSVHHGTVRRNKQMYTHTHTHTHTNTHTHVRMYWANISTFLSPSSTLSSQFMLNAIVYMCCKISHIP